VFRLERFHFRELSPGWWRADRYERLDFTTKANEIKRKLTKSGRFAPARVQRFIGLPLANTAAMECLQRRLVMHQVNETSRVLDSRDLVLNDPMQMHAELKSSYAKAAATFKKRAVFSILGEYQLARYWERHPSEMSIFFQEEFGKEADPKKLLLRVMMALVGAMTSTDEGYENARTYAVALQPFFDRDADMTEVRTELETHGVTRLYKVGMEYKRSRSAVEDRDGSTTEGNRERGRSVSRANSQEGSTEDRSLEGLLTVARMCHQNRHPWKNDIVLLRVGRDSRNALLSLASGQTAVMTVEFIKEKSNDDFVDLVGTVAIVFEPEMKKQTGH
jgi:hypothetical protein